MSIKILGLLILVFGIETTESNQEKNPYKVAYDFMLSERNVNLELSNYFEAFECKEVSFLIRDTLERGYIPFLSLKCKKYFAQVAGGADFFENEFEKNKNNKVWDEFKSMLDVSHHKTFELVFTPLRNQSISVSVRPYGQCSEKLFESPTLVMDFIFDESNDFELLCYEISIYGALHRIED